MDNSIRQVHFATIAANLGGMVNLPQWFVWFLTPSAKHPGKYDKLPVGPHGPHFDAELKRWTGVSLHSPRNWQSFYNAAADVERLNSTWTQVGLFTLGFCLTESDPYYLFDLDLYNMDQTTREQVLAAWRGAFGDVFTETSSSGAGYHLIGRYDGELPQHANKKGYYELYTKERGIAFGLTGTAIGSADVSSDKAIRELIERDLTVAACDSGSPLAWTTEPVAGWEGHSDDAELIEAALNARKSAAEAFSTGKASFRDLWERNIEALKADPALQKDGTGEIDGSDIEYHIAQRLAFYTGKNMARIEGVMRSNRLLYRTKWEEQRRLPGSKTKCTYIQLTIFKACASCNAVHNRNYRLTSTTPDDLLVRSGAVSPAMSPAALAFASPAASSTATTFDIQSVLESVTSTPSVQRPKPILPVVMQQLASARTIDELRDALKQYAWLGFVDDATQQEVRQLVKDVHRNVFDKAPTNAIIEAYLTQAFVDAAEEDDDCKAIFNALYQSWVYRFDIDRYASTAASVSAEPPVKEGVFNVVKRMLSNSGEPGLVILQGWGNMERLLQDRVKVRHVGYSMYIPTPFNVAPIKVATPSDNGSHIKSIESARISASPLERVATMDATDSLRDHLNTYHEGFLNTYNYMSVPQVVEPSDEFMQRFERWKARVLYPMFDNRIHLAEIMMWWVCQNVKYPGQKIRWAPMIIGPQRAGKSTIAQMLMSAMGVDNVLPVAASSLKRQFTGWANQAAVVYFEEMYISGANRYEVANGLKTYITDSHVSVEKKGRDPFKAPNCTNYIGFSNKDDVIPLEADEQRWFIIKLPAHDNAGVLDMLGCRTMSEKDALFEDVYKMFSGDEARGMMRHVLLNYQPLLNGELQVNRHSLPVQTAEKTHLRLVGGSSLMQVITSIIEDELTPYVTHNFVCTEALRHCFISGQTRQMGWPEYTAQRVARALSDLGYHSVPFRPKIGQDRPTSVYMRSEAFKDEVTTLLRECAVPLSRVNW